MKTWFKNHLIWLLLILLGVGTAVGIMVQRNAIEEESRSYDIVADFADYSSMSYRSDYSISEWLEMLADYGVTKVALFETNVKALSENPFTEVQMLETKEVQMDPHWKEHYPAEVVEWILASDSNKDILVTCSDPEEFDWIVNAYETRIDDLEYGVCRAGDVGYLWITGCNGGLSGEKLATFSLGLWPDQVAMIEAAGLQVIPRTKTINGVNGATFANAVYEEFKPYASPYFMNSGDSIVGYDDPKWAAMLTDYLEETNGAFIVTEMMTEIGNIQWGDTLAFVEASNCNAIRAFNEWEFVQKRYAIYGYDGPQEIVNSLYRAVYERNCRLIVLTAIVSPSTPEKVSSPDEVIYITDPEAYERLVTGFIDRMDQYDFSHETMAPAEYFKPGFLSYLLLGLAEVAAAILLLDLFVAIKNKYRYILLALGMICVCGALFAAPNTSKILLSLGGGIVMPCLAGVGVLRYLDFSRHRWCDERGRFTGTFPKVLAETIVVTLGLMLVSFCGALFVSAPLSESAFFLEMRMYRGVKFMQLIPLVIFFLGYLQIHVFERYILRPLSADVLLDPKERRLKRKADWNAFLERPVKFRAVWYGILAVIALAIVGMMGVYYIIRTGNTDSGVVAATEMQFRNMLEELFVARPRTKEYMIGYPCMMLLVWAAVRRIPVLPLFCGAGAVIGYTSIVNTFLHIRTMVAISFSRVLIGLGLGIVIGIFAVIAAEIIFRLIQRLRKRFAA
ncbi:MAG: hypothetical protein IJF43_09375 [Firmicutes bacterium]|nr:hypothetical protein [Bacillota bacterium]